MSRLIYFPNKSVKNVSSQLIKRLLNLREYTSKKQMAHDVEIKKYYMIKTL